LGPHRHPSPLTSERDQNHRLDTATASFTLKLANPAEPAALTAFQTEALFHVPPRRSRPAHPRVIPARDGRTIIPTPDGALRLSPGSPAPRSPICPARPGWPAAIGTALGQLDAALASFQHPAADHHLLWDIRNARGLAPLTPASPKTSSPASLSPLPGSPASTAPALARLPRQVIHGDFNPHNLLADPGNPTRLTGILDFGDMTLSHRICDLAVAASYLIDPADPPSLLFPLTRPITRPTP
jgi:hydroxylysine kinase